MRRSTCATGVDSGRSDPRVGRGDRASAFDFGSWSQAIRVESIPGTDPSFNGSDSGRLPVHLERRARASSWRRTGRTATAASTSGSRAARMRTTRGVRRSNVGPPVNSPQNDFCPTLAPDGRHFYFVSNRPGGCGGADIYATRLHGKKGFEDAEEPRLRGQQRRGRSKPLPPERAGQRTSPLLLEHRDPAGSQPTRRARSSETATSTSASGTAASTGRASSSRERTAPPRTGSRTCDTTRRSCSSSATAPAHSGWPTSTRRRVLTRGTTGRPP